MNLLRNRLGFALRESGQALERVGCILQGINSYAEERKHTPTTRLPGSDSYQILYSTHIH
jgi:hypothetical protein